MIFLYVSSVTLVAQTNPESALKAVFLYNFTKFVSWNEVDSSDAFLIGVLGETEVADYLEDIAMKKDVEGKRIVIYRFDKPVDVTPCNILFFSADQMYEMPQVLDKLNLNNTLSVGETRGFIKLGGAINFVVESGLIRFEINRKAMDQVGLTASAELLKLATPTDE
jgi:hypothetical protein